MKAEEYKLLDGRTIRVKYDRLGMCKISQENLESFVKEFNASYRQAKILEKIKENYALIKLDERKEGKWIKCTTKEKFDYFGDRIRVAGYKCSVCGRVIQDILVGDGYSNNLEDYPYCHCGAKMEYDNKVKA